MRQLRPSTLTELTLASLSMLALLWLLLPLLNSSFSYPSPGTEDFIEYWSAYRVLASGQNPYIPANLMAVQATLGAKGEPLMMWNPPWLLSVMIPVVSLPFEQAALAWALVCLALYSVSLVLVYFSTRPNLKSLNLGLITALITFEPLLQSLRIGQIAPVFAFSIGFFTYAISRCWYVLAGASLALLTFKPHLFYLLFVTTVLWVFRTKNLRLASGFLLGMASLILPILYQSPESISWWLASLTDRQQLIGAVDVKAWVGSNISGALRAFLPGEMGSTVAHQAQWLIPAIFVLTVGVLSLRRRLSSDPLNWLQWIVPLSIITSPFGWIFDQVAAAPALILLAIRSSACGDARFKAYIPWVLVGLNFVTDTLMGSVILYQHQLFWFLPTFFVLIRKIYF